MKMTLSELLSTLLLSTAISISFKCLYLSLMITELTETARQNIKFSLISESETVKASSLSLSVIKRIFPISFVKFKDLDNSLTVCFFSTLNL